MLESLEANNIKIKRFQEQPENPKFFFDVDVELGENAKYELQEKIKNYIQEESFVLAYETASILKRLWPSEPIPEQLKTKSMAILNEIKQGDMEPFSAVNAGCLVSLFPELSMEFTPDIISELKKATWESEDTDGPLRFCI